MGSKKEIKIIETKGLMPGFLAHPKLNIRLSSERSGIIPESLKKQLAVPHRSNYYFLLFMLDGSAEHWIDMEKVTITSGQVLWVTANQVHCPIPSENKRIFFKLSFDEACFRLLPYGVSFLQNPLQQPVISLPQPILDRVKALLESFYAVLTDSNYATAQMALSYLQVVLEELNRVYFKREDQGVAFGQRMMKFIAFKQLVENCFHKPVQIAVLAKELGLSSTSLFAIVKEYSGRSPKAFISQRIMLEAQRLLYYSDFSVKELANKLGFQDPDYFSRLFKRCTGSTVREFIKEKSTYINEY